MLDWQGLRDYIRANSMTIAVCVVAAALIYAAGRDSAQKSNKAAVELLVARAQLSQTCVQEFVAALDDNWSTR
jgi:hypothetical protein